LSQRSGCEPPIVWCGEDVLREGDKVVVNGDRMSKVKPLAGRVAVVAGATRGAGRGIAIALGEAGATVYCTGRSIGGKTATPGRPETLEETAVLVTQAGGKGIAIGCDHTVEDQVVALAKTIAAKHGHLDILVNDVWGGDALCAWGATLPDIPYANIRTLTDRAILSHILTAQKLAPLLLKAKKPILVEVTDGNSLQYRGQFLYDFVKTTVIRLAFAYHEEFAGKIASVAVTPGFLRSEAMLEGFGVTEATWRDFIAKDPDWAESETPRFVGRGIAALAADPEVAKKSGRVYASWTLAKEYDVRDVDGRQPDWGAHFAKRYGPVYKPADEGYYAYLEGGAAVMEAVRRVKAEEA
jgi:NAD(P)-dependent dehydrogenase (short-subunit alcohol dehydrogenase family)